MQGCANGDFFGVFRDVSGIRHENRLALRLLPLFVPVAQGLRSPLRKMSYNRMRTLLIWPNHRLWSFLQSWKSDSDPSAKGCFALYPGAKGLFRGAGIDLLSGKGSVSTNIRYLADVRLDSRQNSQSKKRWSCFCPSCRRWRG
jgi:hypothetical protein